jgi:hypothetical protein
MLPYLNQRFADEGYRLPQLLRTIALSNAFVEVSPGAPANPTSNPTAQRLGTHSGRGGGKIGDSK